MSIIAAAVKHLIAAGVGGDDLVRAIADMEAEMEPRDTRTAAAKRQQRYRDRLAERNGASQSVTRDADVTQPPVLDKESGSPTPPPKEINPTPRARPARTRPDTRLREDWTPEPLIPGSPTEAIVSAWEPGRLERELSKFRDHYRAAPGAKGLARDWQAKWRTWITNVDGFSTERRNGNRPHHDRPSGWAPRPGMEGAEPAFLPD